MSKKERKKEKSLWRAFEQPAHALVVFPRLQEWAIHRHLLHGSLQWPGSAIHQQHHDLPFYHISIDPPAIVLAWGAVACALGLALLPQPLAWTVLGVRGVAWRRSIDLFGLVELPKEKARHSLNSHKYTTTTLRRTG